MTPEKTVTKMVELQRIIQDGISKEEFVTTLENFVKRLLKVEKNNNELVDGVKETMQHIKAFLKEASDKDFREFKSKLVLDLGMLSSKLDEKSRQIDEKMAQLRDGKDGISPDPVEIAKQAAELIKLPEYRAPIMDGPDEIRNKLETFVNAPESEKLDKRAVQGIEKIEDDIKEISLRPMGRGGGGKGIGLWINGSKKLMTAQTINLVPGAGISVVYNNANGRNDITISATGSGAFSVLAATGTIDDTNTAFTFGAEPVIVVVNGASYVHGSGVTISGTSVTLDNPVGVGNSIYGIG